MTGYVQRLLTRSAAAGISPAAPALPLASVAIATSAAPTQSPLAESDQRLLSSDLDGDVLVSLLLAGTAQSVPSEEPSNSTDVELAPPLRLPTRDFSARPEPFGVAAAPASQVASEPLTSSKAAAPKAPSFEAPAAQAAPVSRPAWGGQGSPEAEAKAQPFPRLAEPAFFSAPAPAPAPALAPATELEDPEHGTGAELRFLVQAPRPPLRSNPRAPADLPAHRRAPRAAERSLPAAAVAEPVAAHREWLSDNLEVGSAPQELEWPSAEAQPDLASLGAEEPKRAKPRPTSPSKSRSQHFLSAVEADALPEISRYSSAAAASVIGALPPRRSSPLIRGWRRR